MTRQYLSLYLEPTGETLRLLDQIIAQLAQEFDGPVFAPHLTLIPNRYGTVEEIAQLAQVIAQQIAWPLALTFDQVGIGQTRFQCVFLKAQATPELVAASQTARRIFAVTDLPPFTPHLSLFYANVSNQPKDEVKRQLIARRAQELLVGHLPLLSDCRYIVVSTSGENVSSWHQVAQVTKT